MPLPAGATLARRRARLCAAALCALLEGSARAADSGRFALVEENDGIVSRDDRHYTQGALFAYLSPELSRDQAWSKSFDLIGRVLPGFAARAQSQRRYEWLILGQSQFTPEELGRSEPDPRDRPYAAWLYTGLAWLQENDRRSLHALTAQLGVTGPDALGKQIENGFHTVFGFKRANGWDHQLGNRGAFQFSYDWRRRFGFFARDHGFGADLVPELGASFGTVLRYAETGLLLRAGDALEADYGPQRIRPALSGSGYADARRIAAPGYSFFIGGQARRVLYNRFLDGANEVALPGIDRKLWVFDMLSGLTWWIGPRLRLDFSVTQRSREFTTQRKYDVYGAAALSVAL